MNTVIKLIRKKGALCFILQTEGDNDFWWWEISQGDWDRYKAKNVFATPTMFVNDIDNGTLGGSCGSFLTVDDAMADYLKIEFIKF